MIEVNINIYILKLEYVEYTKIPMTESLTTVYFFGFLVILCPSKLVWFCDTLLQCVILLLWVLCWL